MRQGLSLNQYRHIDLLSGFCETACLFEFRTAPILAWSAISVRLWPCKARRSGIHLSRAGTQP